MAWFSVLCFVCVFVNHVLILCSLLCNGLYVHQFGEIAHNRIHRLGIKNSKKKYFETKSFNKFLVVDLFYQLEKKCFERAPVSLRIHTTVTV